MFFGGALFVRRETIPLVLTIFVVGKGTGGANRDTLRLIKFNGVIGKKQAEAFCPGAKEVRPNVYKTPPQLQGNFFNGYSDVVWL